MHQELRSLSLHLEEGSVVRVAPEGARNIYNSSDEKRVQKDAIYRLK